jgi:broad specificity phosphatase PhoE
MRFRRLDNPVNRNHRGPMHMIRRIPALALAALLAAPAAASAQQATTVILVRHAEKVTSNPLDQNPSLTPEGEQRARDLVAALRGRRVDAIVTTQLKRTRQTARPLAESLHLTPVETHMGRNSDTAAARVATLIRTRHQGQTVLVVGHSTTVPKIIALLGGPALGPICESAYGNLFTLVLPSRGQVRFTHGHYGAADPPGGHECVNGIKEERHAARR